jgi:hypothetical protein
MSSDGIIVTRPSHRKRRVSLQSIGQGYPLLQRADQQTGDDIDRRNQNGRHRIALIETGRTVHCAVKLRLASHCLTPFARRNFVDEAGIQIGINCHLLSR